ncbi:MAG: hypothetical protein GY756_03990, partial [bacterium]|nr:hypothetical protein [bacterium]
MIIRGKRNLSTKTLYSVIFLYILLIILFLFFTDQILKDINEIGPSSIPVIIPLAVLMPVFLLIFIIYYLIKLVKLKRRNYPGVRLKSKLITFFSIIVLFSAIPQTILSFKFINVSTEKWFDDQLGNAINSGVDIALDNYRSYLEDLKDLKNSTEISLIIGKYYKDPDYLWTILKGINHSLSSMQFSFKEKKLFYGKNSCKIDEMGFDIQDKGILPKRSNQGVEILSLMLL